MLKKFKDITELSEEEIKRINNLASELEFISPFDINSKEIEPLWFSHPTINDVFCKIGCGKKNPKIITVWCTMTTDHKKAIFLTLRESTQKEKEYYRSKLSNA